MSCTICAIGHYLYCGGRNTNDCLHYITLYVACRDEDDDDGDDEDEDDEEEDDDEVEGECDEENEEEGMSFGEEASEKTLVFRILASCLIYARALLEYVILILWARSFSKMLPFMKFAEDKVLVFFILCEKC